MIKPSGRRGAIWLALSLGLLSIPFVAVSLALPLPDWQQELVNAPSLGWLEALMLAAVSVITASLVGGSLGGTLMRSRPLLAVVVALGTAWPLAIGTLSVAAAFLEIPLRTGVVCVLGSCTAYVTSQDALSGFAAYPTSLVGGGVLLFPVIVAFLLLVGGVLLKRFGRSFAAIVVTVGAYAALHLMSVLPGRGIAFACLAIGVVIWATILGRGAGETGGTTRTPVVPATSSG